jgi:hypothetical protein
LVVSLSQSNGESYRGLVTTYSDAKRNRDIVVYSLVFVVGCALLLFSSFSPAFGGAGVGLLLAATTRGTSIWYKVKMRSMVASTPSIDGDKNDSTLQRAAADV